MSYEGVIRLAREGRAGWLEIVRGCYEVAKELEGKSFAGAWVAAKVGWFPGLRTLEKYGILRKEGKTVRGGRRAYWVMTDINGVARALRELRYL